MQKLVSCAHTSKKKKNEYFPINEKKLRRTNFHIIKMNKIKNKITVPLLKLS